MTLAEYNSFCGGLVATSHVVQWGGAHVWKVGPAESAKVFAIGYWDDPAAHHSGISFKVSEIGWEVLRDAPGCRPAPYLASRGMKWIQAFDAAALPGKDLKGYLEASHQIVASGLSKKKQRELGLLD